MTDDRMTSVKHLAASTRFKTLLAQAQASAVDIHVKCERCGDTGWMPVGDRVARCVCRTTRTGDAPGCPGEERGVTLADYGEGGKRALHATNAEALKHAALFVEGVHPGLYVWGASPGSGKTALASAILGTIWRRQAGPSCRFVRCVDLLRQLQDGFSNDEDRKDAARTFQHQLEAVDVLVIDDIGTEKGSEFSRRILQQLFDQRVDDGKKTVWTSNYGLDTLAAHLGGAETGGDRLPSRIAGQCKVVRLDGVDWRLRRAVSR